MGDLIGWLSERDLLQATKGKGRNYGDLKGELLALKDCGDIEIQLGDGGVPASLHKFVRLSSAGRKFLRIAKSASIEAWYLNALAAKGRFPPKVTGRKLFLGPSRAIAACG
jgi:hypothetical protein